MNNCKKVFLEDKVDFIQIKSSNKELTYTKNNEDKNLEGCTINFHGGKDFHNILDINSNLGKIKFPGWITLTKNQNGGFANIESSSDEYSIATWIKEKNFPDNYRYIVFENNISSFSLEYTSFFPIKITALDSNNKTIKTIEGNKNWTKEKGYGDFSKLNMDFDENIIKYIKIESFAEYIAINSLEAYRTKVENIKSPNSNQTPMDFDKLFIALSIYLLFFHNNNNNNNGRRKNYRNKKK